MKIAVTTSSFSQKDQRPLELLRSRFKEVRLNPYGRTLAVPEVNKLLSDCVGVLAGTEPYTAEVLHALPALRVISRCGIGLDNVDMAAAAARNILVFSTPDGPSEAVAELTVGMALDLARALSWHDRKLRTGVWEKKLGRLLTGQKVGVVGYGRIGRRVATLFQALGCMVATSDPFVDPSPLPNMPLEALLIWCDGVTLHCPPRAGGVLIGRAELGLMRPESWLINASRGGVVDEEALGEALREGRLSGAAMDAFRCEPYHGPLVDLDQTLLTPHIGSYAREARIAMEMEAAENLIRGLT